FRRLVEHLRSRTDVQNIDLMNLAGFCRNCLSNWMKDAADEKGVPLSKDESREIVYGMPYDEWKSKHQAEATPAQRAAFEKGAGKHVGDASVQGLLCPPVDESASAVDERARVLTAPPLPQKPADCGGLLRPRVTGVCR